MYVVLRKTLKRYKIDLVVIIYLNVESSPKSRTEQNKISTTVQHEQ